MNPTRPTVTRRLALACCALFFSLHWQATLAADPQPAGDSDQIWSALRNGAVVLLRHADAPGFGDPPAFRPGDCTTQRNLGDAGRAQAQRIGDIFRQQRVIPGKVVASQWCRTLDTAELAFPGQVTPEPAFNSFFQDRARADAQTASARSMLRQWSGPGALVVVTHQVNITALTGISPMSGEGIVLRPQGQALVVIGRIQP
jgi:phosphohistidine phosphatase SixA